MKVKISNLIILLLAIYAICISIRYFMEDKVVTPTQDYQKVLDKNDSLMKVNAALEEARTIDKQEAARIRYSLDSIKSVRPKNIKRTNNEVSRLHNSTTAGKLSIIDSILQSRRQH